MCQPTCCSTIYCILPPYILTAIAERGNTRQRDAALRHLTADKTFRAHRAGVRPRLRLVPRERRAVVPEGEKRRTICSGRNQQSLPGDVVRKEGENPTNDPCVDEAYDGLGHTYDLFSEAYGRNSINDEGLPLDATVHYGQEYNNAFWNGQRMVFGDGDGELFNRFTIALDVIAHELTHGVTQDEAGLLYLFQPGALNESISDVFGSLAKQRALNQTADSGDWLIGAGLFTPNVKGEALRSMKAPGTAYDDPVLLKDPQPAHMQDFVHTWEDNGGVHINSGIPNHAFYHVAVQLEGYAWERAGRIWYESLRDPRLQPYTGFRSFARLTADVAGRIYGGGSAEQAAVRQAWDQVGISIS